MPVDTYEWIYVERDEDHKGKCRPMTDIYYCHLENMSLYRVPGKRPMYFAAVMSPRYLRSADHPMLEAAISELNQKLSAHNGGE